MSRTFSASLSQWADATEAQMQEVMRDSVQDIMEMAQTSALGVTMGGTFEVGTIPRGETGDLINRVTSEIVGGAKAEGSTSYVAIIAGMKAGDASKFTWNVDYAVHVENGWTTSTGKQVPGRFFVGTHLPKWPDVVKANAQRIMR